MNGKQYNNVIDWTLKHEEVQSGDCLEAAKAVFKNMGVALPGGDLKEVAETLKTNDYMGWRSCTMQQAQEYANNGTAAIGISENRMVVLSAADEEDPVEETAAVMTLSETTSAYAVSDLQYYAYSYSSTGGSGGGSSGGSTGGSTAWNPGSGQVNGLYFVHDYLSVDVGWSGYNPLTGNVPASVYYTSPDTNVATVNRSTGLITAKNPGIVRIKVTDSSNEGTYKTFELWVRGNKPVFLIHGRTSNSIDVWGATNRIKDSGESHNNHFNPSVEAFCEGSSRLQYTSQEAQHIVSISEKDHTEGGNLADYLTDRGYTKNINLFVFNYPNQDAVVHNATKFKVYLENLIEYIKDYGSNEMKTCFYRSRTAYNNNDFKINIVGHSMGGLVARYYIENLEFDQYVDKLITIDTPHWGSGYADVSMDLVGVAHVLCDHDLEKDSAMCGGGNSAVLLGGCPEFFFCTKTLNYKLTQELSYSKARQTRYYAIAGIDYEMALSEQNDFVFEMPTNFTTYKQINQYMWQRGAYKLSGSGSIPINVANEGDNVVGFLSQIGWTENSGESPNKRIQMERIFVDIDSNGGNGVDLQLFEMINHLHGKIPHRKKVMEHIFKYLQE